MTALTAEAASSRAAARPSWRWRIASWSATAAGVVLLGFVIAHWGWRLFAPAALPPAAMPTANERWGGAILAAPLFGHPAGPAPSGAAGTTAASTPQGDVRLLGVFAERDGGGHALFHVGDRGSILVKAGGQVTRDVTLVEVRPDGVRIQDRGETRDLALRAGATTAALAPARGGQSAVCMLPGYKGPVYRLNAELLTGIASRPEGWTNLLTPVAGGLAVREGSDFATMLGMKAGDRMAQANGIALTRVDDVLVSFVNPIIASQPVHVVGIRDGRPAAWLFLNAGACPG